MKVYYRTNIFDWNINGIDTIYFKFKEEQE